MSQESQATIYKCEKCGATFTSAEMLEKHKKVHEEDKNDARLEQGTQEPYMKPTVPPGKAPNPTGNPPIM